MKRELVRLRLLVILSCEKVDAPSEGAMLLATEKGRNAAEYLAAPERQKRPIYFHRASGTF